LDKTYRKDILKFALERYGTQPEYPWFPLPNYAVLRHPDNRKWYGIIMDVPRGKLGLSENGTIDILDIKCDPLLIGSLRIEPGFLPAYHMHRENWITVLLDGSVGTDTVFSLLEMSYNLTAPKLPK